MKPDHAGWTGPRARSDRAAGEHMDRTGRRGNIAHGSASPAVEESVFLTRVVAAAAAADTGDDWRRWWCGWSWPRESNDNIFIHLMLGIQYTASMLDFKPDGIASTLPCTWTTPVWDSRTLYSWLVFYGQSENRQLNQTETKDIRFFDGKDRSFNWCFCPFNRIQIHINQSESIAGFLRLHLNRFFLSIIRRMSVGWRHYDKPETKRRSRNIRHQFVRRRICINDDVFTRLFKTYTTFLLEARLILYSNEFCLVRSWIFIE